MYSPLPLAATFCFQLTQHMQRNNLPAPREGNEMVGHSLDAETSVGGTQGTFQTRNASIPTHHGQGRPKGSKNKPKPDLVLAGSSIIDGMTDVGGSEEQRRRPGRPRTVGAPVRVTTPTSQPAALVPGVNSSAPLAPIFQPPRHVPHEAGTHEPAMANRLHMADVFVRPSHEPSRPIESSSLNENDNKYIDLDDEESDEPEIDAPRHRVRGSFDQHKVKSGPSKGWLSTCHSCSQTWVSWDSNILKMLPSPLASRFPARLSHRGTMTEAVFALMRCCFQNAMGAKQFTDTINVLHRRRHDLLEVSYLQVIMSRVLETGTQDKYPLFPSFEEGYSQPPSAHYCRDLYDEFLESIESQLDQHNAQLSTRGLAINHSHKITKHIAKVKGEAVFCGLLSMTNEIGEIRLCNLIALKRMNESIEKYGLKPPKIVYTNCMSDKSMLEHHFPSLKTGVQPVNTHSLPPLQLPGDVKVHLCTTMFQTTNIILGLIEQIDEGSGSTLTVRLDTEWDVDIDAWRQNVPDERQTAVMQITCRRTIWIIPLTEFI
ncbi:hypothetical protein BKA70DRAFT_1378804 [Coprinopsis sp. MPI-PUGE-AT-0042]|nr:hypothetical protein BKA70DRAFT_1378804 [Coprinopsis sp. MPI-PUGE-AT-0042]